MTVKQFEDLQFLGEQNRQRYLEGVDWMCNRLTRTTAAGDPVAIPSATLTKMQLAADEIDELRVATTYEEIDHLTIAFS